MPAKPKDAGEFEQIIRWLKTTKVSNEVKLLTSVEALEEAVKALRAAHAGPEGYILGAYHDAMLHHDGPGKVRYSTAPDKLSLFEWACQQLELLFGPMRNSKEFTRGELLNRRSTDK